MRTAFMFGAAAGVLVLATAGCGNGGGGGGGLNVSGAAALIARGGGNAGLGGEISLASRQGIRAGEESSAHIPLPRAPKPRGDAIEASGDFFDFDNGPEDLDPDPGSVVIAEDVVVPKGETLSVDPGVFEGTVEITSTQGNLYVLGTIEASLDEESGPMTAILRARNGAIIVEGTIDPRGDLEGGEAILTASRVYLRGEGTIDVSGRAGPGGRVSIRPFSVLEVGKPAGVHCGPDTRILANGTGEDLRGAPGGKIEVDYGVPGIASFVGLDGTISARGGGSGADVSGGNGGKIAVYWSGRAVVGGTLDVSGGSGSERDGAGGKILFGVTPSSFGNDVTLFVSRDQVSREGGDIAGAGEQLLLLGPDRGESPPEAIADVRGGDGGGKIRALAFEGGVRWNGNALANVVSPAAASEASGGTIIFFASGPSMRGKKADIRVRGTLSAGGADGPDGSSGGSIALVTADGRIDVVGTLDASGGDANAEEGRGGNGGKVFLLVDADVSDESLDSRDDNVGGGIFFKGNALARGGAASEGGTHGAGGSVTMDADPGDGEDPKNGRGRLRAGSLVDVSDGAGEPGGAIILRASDQSGDLTSEGGFVVEDESSLEGDPDPLLD